MSQPDGCYELLLSMTEYNSPHTSGDFIFSLLRDLMLQLVVFVSFRRS